MGSSSFDREATVYLAKLADQAGRHDEMAEAMKSVAIKVVELTAEEKVLLSVGYKKVLGPRRASWRKLSSMLKEESNMNKTNRIIECRNKVEKEMSDIYTDIVLIIECILIPSSEDRDPNSAAFYYKMKGDFIRYLAEFKTGNQRRVAANQSFKAYRTATDIINRAELPATSPIRLGVALNFSVFYRKILGLRNRAIEIARVALDEASSGLELDRSNEEAYKGRDNIMKHLRDNMIVWREEGNNDGGNIPPSA
ncbi:hypothetical protein ACS0TY_017331 [Phlomoides rotata]